MFGTVFDYCATYLENQALHKTLNGTTFTMTQESNVFMIYEKNCLKGWLIF